MKGYITDLRQGAAYYTRYNTGVFANTFWLQFTQSLGTLICEHARETLEANVADAARLARNAAGNDQNA